MSLELMREYHANIVWVAGRPYLLFPGELRVRMGRRPGEYAYYIPVPAPLAGAFHRAHGIDDPGKADGLPVTVLVAKAPWYHGVDMTGITRGMSKRAKEEIRALHLDTPPGKRPVLAAVLATRNQLEQLGLDPDQPITLEDLVEAIRRRLLEEFHAGLAKDGYHKG